MELAAQFLPLAEVQADWLIVPAWEDEDLSGTAATLDTRLDGLLARLREKKDISGKANDLTPLLGHAGLAAERLLVVGLGKRSKADRSVLHDAAAAAARSITGKKIARIALALPEDVPGLNWSEVALA